MLTDKPAVSNFGKKCMFCNVVREEWAAITEKDRHLVVTMDKKDHVHVHGDLQNTRFIEIALKIVKQEVDKRKNCESRKT